MMLLYEVYNKDVLSQNFQYEKLCLFREYTNSFPIRTVGLLLKND